MPSATESVTGISRTQLIAILGLTKPGLPNLPATPIQRSSRKSINPEFIKLHGDRIPEHCTVLVTRLAVEPDGRHDLPRRDREIDRLPHNLSGRIVRCLVTPYRLEGRVIILSPGVCELGSGSVRDRIPNLPPAPCVTE